MAKGTETEEFVILSSVRAGLKREFAFAFKSQAEIRWSLGRTRSAKPRPGQAATEPSSDADDPKSDILDPSDDINNAGTGRFAGDERKGVAFETNSAELVSESSRDVKPGRGESVPADEAVSASPAHNSAEGEDHIVPFVSPKVKPNSSRRSADSKKFPSKLKELLDTGILNGLRVRYVKGPKAREAGDKGLVGMVKGSGIICHCGSCLGTQIVTPTVFELHAGSTNKRPPEYIHLDNGNTLRDIINVCQNSSLVELEENVLTAIGVSVIENCVVCFNCKGSLPEAGTMKSMILCDSCVILMECESNRVEIADDSNRDVTPEPVSAPKLSNSVPKINLSHGKSQVRTTKKDNRLHKLVFEENILPDGTEVAYYARGQKAMVGYKMGSGIICRCCNSEVSPSTFEAHAGWQSRRNPYLHIYTSNGVSLHELALSLTRDRRFSVIDKDDLCFACQGEGDIFWCNGCPRAFHAQCLDVPNPGGIWYCKSCQNLFEREKYVRHNVNALAAGRVAGVDPIEQITNRCIRIMNTEDIDFGGCALCKGHRFSKSGFDSYTVLFCDQCEKEFHVGCLKEYGLEDLQQLPKGLWFCCHDCKIINDGLRRVTSHGPENLPESLLKLIKAKQSEDGLDGEADLDVKWRIVNRKLFTNEEIDSLLSKSGAIFHDRFTPIVDPATKRDLIPEMLHGNSFMGQDFGQMYCAVLTFNESVVCAGIFRIYGSEMAELPLVATNAEYQGQGYFKIWFSCFQRFLSFLNVKNLMLPAASEAESIWTNKFGFGNLDTNLLNELKKRYQMMIFQGTAVLWKKVPKCQVVKKEDGC